MCVCYGENLKYVQKLLLDRLRHIKCHQHSEKSFYTSCRNFCWWEEQLTAYPSMTIINLPEGMLTIWIYSKLWLLQRKYLFDVNCYLLDRLNMGEPFTTDFKITTREPSFVLQNSDQDDGKFKAHSSSK